MTDTSSPQKLAYTIVEAAEALGIGRSTVWRLIKQGRLSTLKLAGRTVIRREELIRLLDDAEGEDAG